MTATACQRWRNGRHGWRSDPAAFTGSGCSVDREPDAVARAFVVQHHYSHSWPATRWRYGLRDVAGALVGVAVFGVPVNNKSLTNTFPDVDPIDAVELSRLVLLDEVPANAESWFVARCFTELATAGLSGVLSFSDPVARTTAEGRLIMPGHVGWVYQALNATYLGRGTARTLTVLRDGTVLNDRTMQKIRKAERGSAAAVLRLVDAGAPKPRRREPGADWLPRALSALEVRKVRHGGNHRYAWPLGATPRQRRRVAIAGDALPYPKTPDLKAA